MADEYEGTKLLDLAKETVRLLLRAFSSFDRASCINFRIYFVILISSCINTTAKVLRNERIYLSPSG